MRFAHLCAAPKPEHYPYLEKILPIFYQSWKEVFPEIKITVCLVRENCKNSEIIESDSPNKRLEANLDTTNCQIIALPVIPDLDVKQQQLLLTVLAPAMIEIDGVVGDRPTLAPGQYPSILGMDTWMGPSDSILLSDLDKFPLQADYFRQSVILDKVSSQSLVSYRDNFFNQQQTLTSYHLASLDVWQKLFTIHDLSSYQLKVKEILKGVTLDPIRLRQLLYQAMAQLESDHWVKLNDQICNFKRLEKPVLKQSVKQLQNEGRYTDLALSLRQIKDSALLTRLFGKERREEVDVKGEGEVEEIMRVKELKEVKDVKEVNKINEINEIKETNCSLKKLVKITPKHEVTGFNCVDLSKTDPHPHTSVLYSSPQLTKSPHPSIHQQDCRLYDRIYIINLETRKDRYYHMLKQLESVNLDNYEFFPAIKPDYEDVLNWHPDYCRYMSNRLGKSFNKYQIGALGCLSSHLKIMEQALEKGYNRILILEDDTRFLHPLTQLIEHLDEINNDFDMLYLTINNMRSAPKVSEHFFRIKKGLTTSAYVVTKTLMTEIIKKLPNYGKEIDVFYTEKIQPKFRCYVYKPYLTTQIASQSDIMQKKVSYRLR